MSYRPYFTPALRRQLTDWQLPDSVSVSVNMYLREVVAARPTRHLVVAPEHRGGMICRYDIIDPGNRFRVHHFEFRVYYRSDEATLVFFSGTYTLDYPW